eukprot:gene1964-2646_t
MSISAIRSTATTPPPMRRAGDIVIEKEVVGGASPDSIALTRTEPPPYTAPVSSRVARPDAPFIAHLIATAEQAPQTRELRRAGVADVEAAYRTVANRNAAADGLTRNSQLSCPREGGDDRLRGWSLKSSACPKAACPVADPGTESAATYARRFPAAPVASRALARSAFPSLARSSAPNDREARI